MSFPVFKRIRTTPISAQSKDQRLAELVHIFQQKYLHEPDRLDMLWMASHIAQQMRQQKS